MSKSRLLLVVIVLLTALVAGCSAAVTPSPTTPPQPAPTLVSAQPVIEVNGVTFTLADLKAWQVSVEAEGKTYTGVRILDLLAKANASGAPAVALIAGDGYKAEVAVADLNDQSILAFGEGDTLDAVIPGQSKGSWVRGTVKIELASAQPAKTEPTAPPAQAAVLTVNGKPFTLDDLKSLEQVKIEVEGKAYTGVRIRDVLKTAGVSGEGILKLVASDGYEGEIAVASLTDQSLLAYNDEGGVNTVLPEESKGAWVKYVVKIQVAAKPVSSEPLPTVKPLAPGDSLIVVDSLGNEVRIPKTVTRVASMRSGITEIICALGQKDKIVAVEEMVKAGDSYGEFITRVHPDLKNVSAPLAGRDISAEEMLRLAPDLVLHGGYGRIKQADALKKQAPDLPVVIAHFETIDAYMNDIRIVAQCINAEERAEKLIAYLQGKLDFIQSKTQDIPADKKTRVFYSGHEIDHCYTPDTFEHAQIELAGGVNVAQELSGWLPEVSPEQLLLWDPEVIIMLNGSDVEAVLNDPKVASVSAIKNKRVYALPEAGWDFSSPRALFCIEWLAAKLYPERFADVDIEAEADEFYQNVFGVDYEGPALAGTH
jgi:iron complex transport system substrate-binding protein